MGVTCDNASNNDTMIESLATIMSQFSGEANRARCLAHIVNLVAKIILRQFDKSKGKKKKGGDEPEFLNHPESTGNVAEDNDNDDEDLDEEEERILDKEEKEMDEGDDEEDDEDAIALERDVEIIERAMEEEIEKATKKGKPVRQVLFKVSLLHYYFFFFLASFLLPLYFPSSFFDIVFLLSIHRFFFGFRCLPGLLSPLLLPVFFFSHHLLCFSIRRFFFWLSIPPRSSISTFLFLCVALRFLPSSFFFFFLLSVPHLLLQVGRCPLF